MQEAQGSEVGELEVVEHHDKGAACRELVEQLTDGPKQPRSVLVAAGPGGRRWAEAGHQAGQFRMCQGGSTTLGRVAVGVPAVDGVDEGPVGQRSLCFVRRAPQDRDALLGQAAYGLRDQLRPR